jgi:hypothetical protein
MSVEYISYLFPMHEVLTVHNGKTGEVSESGITEIVILAYCTDGRIRIESGHDGVGCVDLV